MRFILFLLVLCLLPGIRAVETVAFWAFDEPVGMYPSSVLSDHGPGDHPLILGPGGSLVPGRFGNALAPLPQPELVLPEGNVLFGLTELPVPEGRTMAPMSWRNARFSALITLGENHLRKEIEFPDPTRLGLNLGGFDWTVEFWFQPQTWSPTDRDGVVFEVGEGPRGENARITALRLRGDRTSFVLHNAPSGSELSIPTDAEMLKAAGSWVHLAFVYDAGRGRLRHFVDGQEQAVSEQIRLEDLAAGEEAYFTLLRDGRWGHALPGAIDELRFSRGLVYTGNFAPPSSLTESLERALPAVRPGVTQPLLFGEGAEPAGVILLGNRKHLLIDDAFFAETRDVTFVPTPPKRVDLVYEVEGAFRKHLTVVEDEEGLIRIYNPIGREDRLGVRTSKDGLNFEIPKLSEIEPEYPNITLADAVGTPSVFIDPLAPPEARWKLVSGHDRRGIFLYTSPDGYDWKRVPTAVLSSWSGSQTNMFHDDQRGTYVGYHRTDIGETHDSKTERRFVMTETETLAPPWPFRPLTQADYDREAGAVRLDVMRPWYLDNGPLSPGGIGIEYPTVFAPRDGFDPTATDIYVPKAVKYPWAPDTYLAFPCVYFHYYEGPLGRQVLALEERARGSGPIEIQLMASRNGVDWSRYPRPTWINVGRSDGLDIHQTYIVHGMVRRGDEIWMYTYNTEEYHSSHRAKPGRRGVYRTVNLLDRFVAAVSPYDREAYLMSHPFTFAGSRLSLNVDTGATGFIQVGLVRGDGRPIEGFGEDDGVYVNGNELDYTVE